MAGSEGSDEWPSPDGRGSLRLAFGGLTTRGRSFLAAGVAATACAYVLGQPDLLRVGLLLAALPLLCVILLHRTRHLVSGSRQLVPTHVPVGTDAQVRLRIDNVARLPTGSLMLQDKVPYVLGPRPRFVLDRIEPAGRREVSYRVRSDLRGQYPLGPLQLRLTDPFGMCELIRSFSTYDTLTVVPRVERLPPTGLGGESGDWGEGRQRAMAVAGDDDVIPRGYRHGDDLRRVHWRSTARYGELMVRREEQPRKARCTVLLDTRRVAYNGSGPESPFEWAISGAASVCVHLVERGHAIRLLTDTGPLAPPSDGGGDFQGPNAGAADLTGLVLDSLATVGHSTEQGLTRACEALRGDGGGREGLVIAFLGALDGDQVALAQQLRQHASRAVAFVADPGDDGGDAGQAALREAGWTVLPGGPGATLADVWLRADNATVRP